MENLIFLIHCAATVYLVGVIWTVQLLVYPSMRCAGRGDYAVYHKLHTMRITPIVAPAMILELLTAIYFAFVSVNGIENYFFRGGLILVLIIWASTFFVQVPLHNTLGAGFAPAAQTKLVSTNWIRTAAWTLRGGLILWMIWVKIK